MLGNSYVCYSHVFFRYFAFYDILIATSKNHIYLKCPWPSESRRIFLYLENDCYVTGDRRLICGYFELCTPIQKH